MRVRVRAVLPATLVLAASVFLRACEAPTARKAVEAVNVTPPTVSLHPTQTSQLTAATLDDGGAPLAGRTVTWGSSNNGVATVNGSGLVTAVAAGTATITATSEGVDGTSEITVTPVPVVSVTVAPPAGNVVVGLTLQLTATPRDSIAGALLGRVVTWESSNDAIATVSGTGLVTGVAEGDVTITATSEGIEGTADVSVEAPPAPVDSVAVSPDAATRYPGQTVQLTAATFDSVGGTLTGRVVTWESSNDAVATVNANGLVTAVAVGMAIITATSEGIDGTSAITVDAVPVDSVSVTPPTATLVPAQTVQLAAATFDSAGGSLAGRVVTWESSDDAVATVSVAGLVTAVAVGSATITATSEGVEGTAAITVEAAPAPVDSVAVTPPAATRYPGQTVQLTATTFDSAGGTLVGRVVTWESSDDAVATVNGSGLVTAVAVGVATITATSESVEGTATITVEAVPVDSVAVTPPAATRYPGQTVQLTATTFDSAGGTLVGRVVTWESSDDAVATVNGSGLVTAVAVGSATITATSEGVDATAAITVALVPVSSVEVTPDSAEVEEGETQQFAAVTKDSAGGTLVGRTVTWTSLDGGIASVDASGLATAIAEGLARIVATSEGRADTARLSVTAPAAPGSEVVGPFDISVTASREHTQGVATDGTNALFLLQRELVPSEGTILHYQLIDSTGAALTPLNSLGLGGDPPAVAFGGGAYLAATALHDDVVGEGIHGWLFSQAGAPQVSAFQISVNDGSTVLCGLAYAGGTFVVTYQREIEENPGFDSLSAIFGRTVSTAGTVGAEFAVSEDYASCDFGLNNSLASSGSGFLAVWDILDSATNATSRSAKARTISTSGVVGPIHTIHDVAVDARLLTVAARAGGGWVAGFGDMLDESTGNFDASVQLLAADGSVSGAPIVIESGSVSVIPTVGEWDSGFAVLLIERPALAADQALTMRFYTGAGTQSGSPLTLTGVDGAGKVPVSLSFDGVSRFFVGVEYYTPGATLVDFDQNTGDVRGIWIRP